jgi:hypothetical protein
VKTAEIDPGRDPPWGCRASAHIAQVDRSPDPHCRDRPRPIVTLSLYRLP